MSHPSNPVISNSDLKRQSNETALEMIDIRDKNLTSRSNCSDDGERGVNVVGGGSLSLSLSLPLSLSLYLSLSSSCFCL